MYFPNCRRTTIARPGVAVVVIEKSDLEIGDELGGEVYKARWNSRNMTVALKRLTGRLEDGEVEL